jgi:5'(3')-deoxyribonucleotidase
MDGVLADFNTAAEHFLRSNKAEHQKAAETGRWPDHQWRKIASIPNFYRNLPKMPLADELVELAVRFRDNLDYDVKILTAIPHNNDMHDCFHDKVDWMQEHYGQHGFRVHFGPYSEDKQKHCKGPLDILVDDRTSNCREWRSAGGTAVQVKENQYQLALDELEAMFREGMTLSLI